MSRAMNAEEQLEDLHRRYALLEGERRATVETAKLNITQNKDIIKQMKEENKSLRHQIAQLRQEAPPSTEQQIEKELQDLNKKKHEIDAISNEVTRKIELAESLRDKMGELAMNAAAPSTENDSSMRHIRVLENRLDKAMIKYNEAQSIRKTYEQIVKRLKDERVGFDTQLAAIERALAAKTHDHAEMLLLAGDATHAKDLAHQDLERCKLTYQKNQNQRQKELKDREAMVKQKEELNSLRKER